MKHLLSAEFFRAELPLHVAEARHGAVTPHRHEFFELVYVLEGRGIHHIDATAYPIRTGDVYVISPDEPHAYHPAGDGVLRIVNVLFLPDILPESLLRSPSLSGLDRLLYIEPLLREEAHWAHRLNLAGAAAYRVEALLHEMQDEQHAAAPGYEIVLRNLFCTLLVLLSRGYEQLAAQSPAPAWSQRHAVVEAALRFIELHHTEALSLDRIARHASISPSRLAHIFKEHTRRSILHYLHEYRVGRICDDLLRTDRPVSELALNMGYGDLGFFGRVFRRHVGCSPTEYRRRFGCERSAGHPVRE